MDEHLLGVKVNDQKAHLQKVLEEVGIANAELSKTFALIKGAKDELDTVRKTLADKWVEIAAARESLEGIRLEAEGITKNAAEKMAQAEEKLLEASLEVITSEIRAELIVDAAEKKAASLHEEIAQLEGFVEASNAKASVVSADLGSLESQREDVYKELINLRNEEAEESAKHDEAVRTHKDEFSNVVKQVSEAKEVLEKTRKEKEVLLENLDRREQNLKVAENDIAILQGRLRFMIQQANQQNTQL